MQAWVKWKVEDISSKEEMMGSDQVEEENFTSHTNKVVKQKYTF